MFSKSANLLMADRKTPILNIKYIQFLFICHEQACLLSKGKEIDKKENLNVDETGIKDTRMTKEVHYRSGMTPRRVRILSR